MKTRDCATDGHCYHEDDGTVYQRHNARPHDDVRVHCCHCVRIAHVPMYATCSAGTILTSLDHGPSVTAPT